jgi:MoxR-like ATPase
MTIPNGEKMTLRLETSADGHIAGQTAEKIRALREQVIAQVNRVVVGMESVTEQFLIALLANGHVLLEGVP